MLSLKKYTQLEDEIFMISNQLSKVCLIINKSLPINHPLVRFADSIFLKKPMYALLNLRYHLNDQAIADGYNIAPFGRDLLCRNPRLDFDLSFLLLGVPPKQAKAFQLTQKSKPIIRTTKKKTRLIRMEIHTILRFLSYCSSRIAIISISVVEHYGHDHKTVTDANDVIKDFTGLLERLQTHLKDLNEVTA